MKDLLLMYLMGTPMTRNDTHGVVTVICGVGSKSLMD